MTRRDRCHLVGVRAERLNAIQSGYAWNVLAGLLQAMGERDVPKFDDVMSAIRAATIEGASLAKDPTHFQDHPSTWSAD